MSPKLRQPRAALPAAPIAKVLGSGSVQAAVAKLKTTCCAQVCSVEKDGMSSGEEQKMLQACKSTGAGGLPLHAHSSPQSQGLKGFPAIRGHVRIRSSLRYTTSGCNVPILTCSPDLTLWVNGSQLPRGQMQKEEEGRAGRNCL